LISAAALPQTPLGELTALPQASLLNSRGPTSRKRGREKENGIEKRRNSEGRGRNARGGRRKKNIPPALG